MLTSAGARRQTPGAALVIRDVRVFDGERVVEHRTVSVAEGWILRVSSAPDGSDTSAEVIRGAGRTLLPGLIDAHVHVADDAEGALHQALMFGVTTVLDMFNGGGRLARIKTIESDDAPDVAAVRTAGTGATAPGGPPTQLGGGPLPTIRHS